jgi:hypothetical protein
MPNRRAVPNHASATLYAKDVHAQLAAPSNSTSTPTPTQPHHLSPRRSLQSPRITLASPNSSTSSLPEPPVTRHQPLSRHLYANCSITSRRRRQSAVPVSPTSCCLSTTTKHADHPARHQPASVARPPHGPTPNTSPLRTCTSTPSGIGPFSLAAVCLQYREDVHNNGPSNLSSLSAFHDGACAHPGPSLASRSLSPFLFPARLIATVIPPRPTVRLSQVTQASPWRPAQLAPLYFRH